MSVQITPPPARRLRKLVEGGEPLSMPEAVAAADVQIAEIREAGLEELAATVTSMRKMGETLAKGRDPEIEQALYRSSNSLIGIAAPMERPLLGEAAYALCSLLDRFAASGTWNGSAVTLCLDSLQVILDRQQTEEDLAAMVRSLEALVRKLGG